MGINELISALATKSSDSFQDLKADLHGFVIGRFEEDEVYFDGDLDRLRKMLSRYIHEFCRLHDLHIGPGDQPILEQELLDEIVGYGPLQSLLEDESIDDILINGARRIFVERAGVLEKTQLRFIDDQHVTRVIRRMIAPLGRRIDESNPIVDGRLPDGSRINAIIPPLSLEGPCLSIRKFKRDPLTESQLIANKAVTPEAMDFLQEAVRSRRNILICGATGSGKTTLLNVLSQYIDHQARVVTIEDAAELQLRNDHVVRLETRPENSEGSGEISARELLRNALRMRPDRIIVGESRGSEVLDMLQAMNTGHSGSMSTIHANSTLDALTRLEMMVAMSGFQGSGQLIQRMIASALDVLVHVSRLPNGQRNVLHICELQARGRSQAVLRDCYRYDFEQNVLLDVYHEDCLTTWSSDAEGLQ